MTTTESTGGQNPSGQPPAIPRTAWAIVGAAVPVHLALALTTDLSPDEAYYLCAARLGGRIVDHPPLLMWLLAASDRWAPGPVELRVRLWAVMLSFATGIACVLLARSRGAGRHGCVLAAWVGSWALLPMAGGFVTTPDGPLLAAIALALLVAPRLEGPRPAIPATVVGLSLLAGALAKVVALPIAALLALSARRAPLPTRVAVAAVPLLALPLLAPSLGFQLRHAYGSAPATWSIGAAAGALVAALGAQAVLWSPAILWLGLRRWSTWSLPDRTVVGGLSALVLASALVRGVPPEPNWWAPAALVVLASGAAAAGELSPRARRAILAALFLPTALAAAHTARPFLPLPERADPTARLHGWSRGPEPLEAAGTGPYGPASERCVYRSNCEEIRMYFEKINLQPTSRR